MLKIWGRLSSINVRKVVLTAQWLGVAFERIDAGREFGIVGSDEYLAKNPNGKVPLLADDGFELWESNVIVRYLCALEGSALYPVPLRARFDAERWMDWQQTTFNPAGRDAFIQLIRTPERQREQTLITRSIDATEPLLTLLDRQLDKHAFVAGDQLTMADLPLACELHRWRGLPIQQHAYENVDRWYAWILAQPATRGVLDVPLA